MELTKTWERVKKSLNDYKVVEQKIILIELLKIELEEKAEIIKNTEYDHIKDKEKKEMYNMAFYVLNELINFLTLDDVEELEEIRKELYNND